MSNYTKQISWSGKDALSDSDPEKVISGGDFDTEFSAVQTAINSKIDDIVDDTTPQLGGDLDFQTHKATSFTSTGIDDNSTSTAITIDSSEKVSIGGSGSVSSDSQVAIKGGNLELATAGAKYWIPRASDGALTGSLYSPSGSVVRLSGALTSAGTIEFEPRSSNGVIARVTGDGLCFGSDTAAANALDDYEEGDWTPTAVAGLTGLATTSASYTKVGRTVTVTMFTGTFTGKAAAQVVIGGLPFTSLGYNTYHTGLGETSNGYTTVGRIASGSTSLVLYKTDSASSQYLGTQIGNHLIWTATYQTT